MKITSDNFEEYMIDYLDNRLNPVLQKQMEEFMERNPRVREEMELLREQCFSQSGTTLLSSFPEKQKLYRSLGKDTRVTEHNFEEYCVAFYENDLDTAGINDLKGYLDQYPDNRASFELFEKLYFRPDPSVKMHDKSRLLKRSTPRLLIGYRLALTLAASIVLAILLFRYMLVPQQNQATQIAVQEKGEVETGKEQPAEEEKKPDTTKKKTSIEKKAEEWQPVILASEDTRELQSERSLEPMEPITVTNLSVNTTPGDVLAHLSAKPETSEPIGNDFESGPEEGIGHKPSDQLLVNALRMGIRGINNLTESNLAFITEEDPSGNIQGFKIESESFEFSRKLRKNLQR